MKRTYNAWWFLLVCYSLFLFYTIHLSSSVLNVLKKDSTFVTKEISQIYANTTYGRKVWINLYGLSQRIIGKDVIENFTLCRNSYGKIISPVASMEQTEIDNAAENIKIVYHFLEEKNIPVYYITSLLPISNEEKLPGGMVDYSHENAVRLQKAIGDIQIPIIDLRAGERIGEIQENARFYRTDHHWSMEACYASYAEIINRLEQELGWDLSNKGAYVNLENYYKLNNEKSFLGSYGVKMGEWYTKMDDFVCFIPNWNTEFSFEAYGSIERDGTEEMICRKTGDFLTAMMDIDRIEDKDYYNKFMAFSNGYNVENRVINELPLNDRKLLLISHSYGRPLTQYLALSFKEVRNLDPQLGRYNKNYLQYIEDYKPDLVLILTEFEGGIYFPITVE